VNTVRSVSPFRGDGLRQEVVEDMGGRGHLIDLVTEACCRRGVAGVGNQLIDGIGHALGCDRLRLDGD
jgi:hypothetical protein